VQTRLNRITKLQASPLAVLTILALMWPQSADCFPSLASRSADGSTSPSPHRAQEKESGEKKAEKTTVDAADDKSAKNKSDLKLPGSGSGAMGLTDLRDVGLCVMQIKQQAINIYLEATRKPVDVTCAATLEDPSHISVHGLATDTKYLEARPEWLTFYIGTMEPIIHLFKEDVKDVETGIEKVIVPKGTKDKFEKLFDEYETAVNSLNEHLSNIYEEIHQTDNNVKIAKEAIKIFELADSIEKGRQEAFHLLKGSADTEETEELDRKRN
jgi:hypothetical protein